MDFHGNLPASLAAFQGHEGDFRDVGIREIVIVDPRFDRYGDLVRAAQAGRIGLHFCADGRSALRLARSFRADAWLVSADLPDMSGFDLVEMLRADVALVADEPSELETALPRNRIRNEMVAGRRATNRLSADLFRGLSSDRRQSLRPGIFLVADAYRVEDEQRALAAGIAGYVVGPMTAETIVATRQPSAAVLS